MFFLCFLPKSELHSSYWIITYIYWTPCIVACMLSKLLSKLDYAKQKPSSAQIQGVCWDRAVVSTFM